jgi:diphthamide biosynthesis protein 7
MSTLKSVRSLILDLPPSCIAFCPTQPDLFVVGTYHLHRSEDEGEGKDEAAEPTEPDDAADDNTPSAPKAQKRTGSLILYRLENDEM